MVPGSADAGQLGAAEDPETARIRSALLARRLRVWRNCVGRLRGDARGLLADMLDWHRREDRARAWWRYFYLRTLSPVNVLPCGRLPWRGQRRSGAEMRKAT